MPGAPGEPEQEESEQPGSRNDEPEERRRFRALDPGHRGQYAVVPLRSEETDPALKSSVGGIAEVEDTPDVEQAEHRTDCSGVMGAPRASSRREAAIRNSSILRENNEPRYDPEPMNAHASTDCRSSWSEAML